MTLDAIKLFFRRKITVIAGGPTDLTRGRDELAVLDALADVALGSPNDRPSYRKAVRFFSANTPNYVPGELTLAGLNPEFLALHTECVVEFGPAGYTRTYQLRYDSQGPVTVYREYGGGKLPASWVLTDAPQAGVPSYAYLQAVSGVGGYSFAVDELVRDYAGTATEYFFAARVIGTLPAPSSPIGDANWRRVSPDELPVPGPRVAPNTTRGADKRTRFLTNAQLAAAGGPGAGDSLEGIANDSLCLGQLAAVEFYGPGRYNVTLRLVYDGDPRPTPDPTGVYAYRTGHCEPGDVLPARWVEVTAEQLGVPTYTQLEQSAGVAGYSFTVGELVRDFAGTATEYFFAALNAGLLPAPTSAGGDGNWRRVSAAEIPTPQTPFFLRITQAQAINLDDDEAVYSGRRYAVDFGGGKYVELVGTEARHFPYVGVLNGEEVKANIHNGYVELTGPESVSYADLMARFADTPPIPGKLYGIGNRVGSANDVVGRFDNISQWQAGGVTPGMLVAQGAEQIGTPGAGAYDLGADVFTVDQNQAVVDVHENKAIRIKPDRSRVYYTGAGTAANAGADDAIQLALSQATAGDFVYNTTPIVQPYITNGALILRIPAGVTMSLGGFDVVATDRRDGLGPIGGGKGVVFGNGAKITSEGSYALYCTGAANATADYVFYDVHLEGLYNPTKNINGGGMYCKIGKYTIYGTVKTKSNDGKAGLQVGDTGQVELVGDLSAELNGQCCEVSATGSALVRSGRVAVLTPTARLGDLYASAKIEFSDCVIDLQAGPTTSGLRVMGNTANAIITLTDATVLAGAIVQNANPSKIILRGSTTLPAGYGVNYLLSLGMDVDDQREVDSALPQNQIDALNAAYQPAAGNPFLTASAGSALLNVAPLIVVHAFDNTSSYTYTDLAQALFWSQSNGGTGHGGYGGTGGYTLLNRPYSGSAGQIGQNGTLDLQLNPLGMTSNQLHLWRNSRVLNNRLIYNGLIFIRAGSEDAMIQGGTITTQIQLQDASSKVVLDGVTVTKSATTAAQYATIGGGTIILRNGSQFLNWDPDPATVIITEPAKVDVFEVSLAIRQEVVDGFTAQDAQGNTSPYLQTTQPAGSIIWTSFDDPQNGYRYDYRPVAFADGTYAVWSSTRIGR